MSPMRTCMGDITKEELEYLQTIVTASQTATTIRDLLKLKFPQWHDEAQLLYNVFKEIKREEGCGWSRERVGSVWS